ncbi:MAG: ATP-binding protein [Acidimicrobiia bacterium]|jgi:two-component system phosphate regulon sensor histidine kinase PhoR
MTSRQGYRTKLSSRFVVYYAITYLVMIGLMGFIVERTARDALTSEVDENLAVAARLATESLPDDPVDYERWVRDTFTAGGFRTTLIDTEGVVLADSHSDPAVMENHLQRPEVQIALSGEVGEAQRISGSTGFEQRYVALPPEEGLIVRTSVATRVIDDELSSVRTSIVLAASALGLLGVALMAFLGRRLARPITELTAQARAVAEGDTKVSPRRSRVAELDQLGLAISTMANRLGVRLSDAEEATATLGVVLEALPQGTVLIDGDDQVVYVNPAARSILGNVPDSLSALAPLQLQNAVREARINNQNETRLVDHGSPPRRLRAVATPFVADDRVLLLVVDITDSERTDSIRRDFVANASHELKTPVSTIIASSEALQIALERRDGSASGFADRIEGSARQLDRLVADLLDLSRLERDKPEMTPVRLDHLVRDEVERIRGEAEAKQLDLQISLNQVTAMANHRDVAIAVRNLLDNAVRYTNNGGSIMVGLGIDHAEAVISVADSGEGIPTRDVERVFERFYRVDSARSRGTGGTGLGLSIVKHVAESHGGGVSVDSELGVGSTFTVRLPLGERGAVSTAN